MTLRARAGTPGVGLALAPDPEWLGRCEGLLDEVDYVSVTPETLWRGGTRTARDSSELAPNGFWHAFAALREERGLPFVAHSVGYSLAGGEADLRRAAWRAAVRRDHATFAFRWWTDHGGATTLAGQNLSLPLPAPFTEPAAARVRARLAEMGTVVPAVGVENTAHYLLPGPPLDEPAWLAAAIGDHHLLLDLHNLWVMATNFGYDPEAWLARAPLDRVIEIHVAGGRLAPTGWTSRPMRLDGHDAAVPDEVWALLRSVLPRCPALRGVTLERTEGSVGGGDVSRLRGELRRIRAELAQGGPT